MSKTVGAILGSLFMAIVMTLFMLYIVSPKHYNPKIKNGLVVYYVLHLYADGTEQGKIHIDQVKDEVWSNLVTYPVQDWGRLQCSYDKEGLKLLLTPVKP